MKKYLLIFKKKFKYYKKYIKMDKPVIVLILSERCGACINFKRKILPELKEELENDSKIKTVILDFPEMAIPSINNKVGVYHPELRNGFVRFFPTIALFPGNLWNYHDTKLKGVVKHGDEENPRVDYSKSSILKWIKETIKDNDLFEIGNESYIVPTYGQFKNSKIDETEL